MNRRHFMKSTLSALTLVAVCLHIKKTKAPEITNVALYEVKDGEVGPNLIHNSDFCDNGDWAIGTGWTIERGHGYIEYTCYVDDLKNKVKNI